MPTYRNDNAKGLTTKHLSDHILTLKLVIIDDTNICRVHLGERGLDMNGKGTGRLAMNIILCMQDFWHDHLRVSNKGAGTILKVRGQLKKCVTFV